MRLAGERGWEVGGVKSMCSHSGGQAGQWDETFEKTVGEDQGQVLLTSEGKGLAVQDQCLVPSTYFTVGNCKQAGPCGGLRLVLAGPTLPSCSRLDCKKTQGWKE